MGTVQSKDGTTIVFDQTGTGPAVILVGGAMATRKFDGAVQLAEILAPQFTVIIYDRRGHGDSDDQPPYAVAREIEDLAALINEAGGSALVYGHSSGAAVALEAAVSGLAITKLAMFEPPYVAEDSPANCPPADAVAKLTELAASGRRGDAVEYFMVDVMRIPAQFVTPMRDTPMWPGLEKEAHTLAYDITLLGDWLVPRERVAGLTLPTLVMDGENSPPMLRNAVQAVADALPNARRVTIAAQGHDVAPATIASVLTEFFKA
jgi:pimeloyl-ACP methyl ester carboxylesterase